MFVSGLSVSEFVLLPGIRVLGIVYGTVVHTTGKIKPPEVSRVMKTATRNQNYVIAAAIERLQENACQMSATGVVGVQIRHRTLEDNLLEYTMSGTAIAEANSKPQAKPVVCTLSGQQYSLLVSSGYRPVGIACGVSIYSQKLHQRVQQKVERQINTERSDFTRGLYAARKYALAALHQEAVNLGAEGVLSMQIHAERTLHRRSGFSSSMMINLVAAGTAVASCPGSTEAVEYAVFLTDKRNNTR